jgi:hypothetical protein
MLVDLAGTERRACVRKDRETNFGRTQLVADHVGGRPPTMSVHSVFSITFSLGLVAELSLKEVDAPPRPAHSWGGVLR